jgi:hypothetical protein
MGRNPGVRLNSDGKVIIEQDRKDRGFTKQDPRFLQITSASLSTWKRFVTGKRISEDSFQHMCLCLGYPEWKDFIDSDGIEDGIIYSGLSVISNDNKMGITLTLVMRKNISDVERNKVYMLFEHLKTCLNDVSVEVSEEDGTFFVQGIFKDEETKAHALICIKKIEEIQAVSLKVSMVKY